MADRKVVVEKDGDKTSGYSERQDENGVTHVTTFVDIPGVGSLRSSYDENEAEGEISNQHITLQRKDD